MCEPSPKSITDDKTTRSNLLHEYHKVIDQRTGEIDKTDWKVCPCTYCSIWTPDVVLAYEEFIREQEAELDNERTSTIASTTRSNLLHEYHKVIDQRTGEIDKTDWKVCPCTYCSIWTPDVVLAYEEFIREQEAELDNERTSTIASTNR